MFVAAIGYLLASSISDNIGRVKTFRICTTVALGLALSAYFIDNVTVKVIACGFLTAEEGILCGLFTIIINETCTTKSPLRVKGLSFYFCIFALGGVVVSGVTYIVTESDNLY